MRFLLILALAISTQAWATTSHTLLSGVIGTGYSVAKASKQDSKTFQAVGITSAGAGAATVIIQCTNKPSPTLTTDVDWVAIGTITLVLSTTSISDGFASDAAWNICRAKLSAISGTNATVSVYMGQ